MSMRCFARTTMPGIQNPHCNPPETVKDFANISRSCSFNPSRVNTLLPAAFSAGTAQDDNALPSTITVQQPHEPCGAHPFFGDINPAFSLSRVINEVPFSTSVEKGLPLRVNSMCFILLQSILFIHVTTKIDTVYPNFCSFKINFENDSHST